MNKEKQRMLIFSVLGLVVSLVGLSYAFFMAKVSGNESESTVYGVAANLTIEFREGTSQISASDIFLGWSATKTFYVKNNSASEGEYSLKLFDVENYFMEESISFEITSTNDGANIEKRNLPTNDETLKDVIKIAGTTMQEYTVKVYYNNLDVNQSVDLGKNFTFKIGIGDIVDDRIVLTNLITNGDFSYGATGWSMSMSKEPLNDVSNSNIYSTGFFTFGRATTYQYYNVMLDHKIYVKTSVIMLSIL